MIVSMNVIADNYNKILNDTCTNEIFFRKKPNFFRGMKTTMTLRFLFCFVFIKYVSLFI